MFQASTSTRNRTSFRRKSSISRDVPFSSVRKSSTISRITAYLDPDFANKAIKEYQEKLLKTVEMLSALEVQHSDLNEKTDKLQRDYNNLNEVIT